MTSHDKAKDSPLKPTIESKMLRRSTRERKVPAHLKDYFCECFT